MSAPIIFYDGLCGFCDGTVQWLLWFDRGQRKLKFAPLQGTTAQERLPAELTQDLRSLVLVDDAGRWRFSTSVVRILWHLGGLCGIAGGLLWLIPRPLRDAAYHLVARNRYQWFGRREACRLPSPEERACFLP